MKDLKDLEELNIMLSIEELVKLTALISARGADGVCIGVWLARFMESITLGEGRRTPTGMQRCPLVSVRGTAGVMHHRIVVS